MPRQPQFRTSAVRELFRQLSYAPSDARWKHLERSEALAVDIDPQQVYPEEYIIYRITSYRPDAATEPVVLVGEALLADLATFIQELSRTLPLPASCEQRGDAKLIDERAAELGIAARTLRRYHRRGLLFHYVQFGAVGAPRLACYDTSLHAFAERHPGLLDRARAFSRLDDAHVGVMIDRAIALHREHGWTRQRIARHLAREFGRGVETIRAMLARHEQVHPGSIVPGRRRIRSRERRFITRAADRGIEPSAVAHHVDRHTSTIRRVIAEKRLARLRAWPLAFVSLPTFELPDAESVILASPAVTAGLGPAAGVVDAMELLGGVDRSSAAETSDEAARISAYNLLKRRVKSAREHAGRRPSDNAIDAMERDLRWAALLKRTVVYHTLPVATGRLDQTLHRPLAQQQSGLIRALLAASIEEISKAIETVDPGQGQVLSRICAMAIDRRLARMNLDDSVTRAGVRHAAGDVLLYMPLAHLCPWQRVLELPARLVGCIDVLEPEVREIVVAAHGLTGCQPMTVAEIADTHALTERSVRARLRSAIRTLRTAWRTQ